MTEELIREIESYRTAKQVLKALEKNKIEVIRDDTDEVGCFSIWIDETTRIYKPIRSNMKVQKWQKTKVFWSGIPTFFGTPSYF